MCQRSEEKTRTLVSVRKQALYTYPTIVVASASAAHLFPSGQRSKVWNPLNKQPTEGINLSQLALTEKKKNPTSYFMKNQ